MSMNFDKWDKNVDIEGLKKDVEEAKENGGGEYKEVPLGEYVVAVEKIELTLSNTDNKGNIRDKNKDQNPMVSIWFKILEGEFKNSRLFFNQIVTQGFQIHIVNELLRSMDSGIDIEFETYNQYSDLLMDVAEAVDGKLEFAIDYGEKKGFKTFKITEIFEVE